MKRSVLILVVGLVAGAAGTVHAADAEQKCQAGRAKAKGSYVACVQNQLTKAVTAGFVDTEKLTKCVTKYAGVWAKLQKLVGSTSCGPQDRFVDNGTTVTDRLTLLTWEKKSGAPDDFPNNADPSDPDHYYGLDFSADDDGAAYSIFLGALNSYPGLGNARGWRLPTLAELLTIRGESAIGPINATWYWSTTVDQANTGQAWRVHFGNDLVLTAPKWGVNQVRAVRGGL